MRFAVRFSHYLFPVTCQFYCCKKFTGTAGHFLLCAEGPDLVCMALPAVSQHNPCRIRTYNINMTAAFGGDSAQHHALQ